MGTQEVKEFISRIELFKGLDDHEMQTIADELEETAFRKGDFLFKENQPREHIFIIFKGEVELFKKSPYGAEKRLTVFGRYDFLGEGSLMDDSQLKRE